MNAKTEVNIEEIMQTIRKQILAKKGATGQQPLIQIEGKHLPPDFYEHLYQAGLAYDQLQVPLNVSQRTIPIIGPILQAIRGKIHELVLFYVNQLAANQIRVNTHLLQALSILSQELEKANTIANKDSTDEA